MGKFLALILVVFAFTVLGCGAKSAQSQKPTGSKLSSTPGLTRETVQGELTEGKTNVYIRGQKINFYSDKIDLIKELLGPSKSSEAGSVDSKGHVTYMYENFEKIKVSYNTQTGELGNIIIDSPVFPIESDGKVGDTRETIMLKYPSGFYRTIDDHENKGCYYYFRMAPNKATGIGFRFFFNKDNIVTEIVLGGWSFTE